MSRHPKPIADVLSQLMARRGYARQQSAAMTAEAWLQAAGEQLGRYTRVGVLRNSVLEVWVANSTIVQELTFQKTEILARLTQNLDYASIRDLRFRVGSIG